MGIKPSQKCNFCQQVNETYRHLFIECQKVQLLWKWFESKTNRCITDQDIIFNSIDPNPKLYQNTVILVTKHYIYQSKCLGNMVSVQSLRLYVKQYILLEKCIAQNKNKLNQHKLKWQGNNLL